MVISIVNLLTVIPVYLSGHPLPPKEGDSISLISRITILNIGAEKNKAIAIFILIFLLYSTSVCFLIFFYWKKSI